MLLFIILPTYLSAQNYLTYSPDPPNRPFYYQKVYLDTVNHYYYISNMPVSYGTYKEFNDSTIVLHSIIDNPFKIKLNACKVSCRKKIKNKIYFQVKHHFVNGNTYFMPKEDKSYGAEDFFAALYVELNDGEDTIIPFKDANICITEKYALVSGWTEAVPANIKSISLSPLPIYFYIQKQDSLDNSPPTKVELNLKYRTEEINVIPKPGNCFSVETLFLERTVWHRLGSELSEKGDTLIFHKDKLTGKLIELRWNLRKIENYTLKEAIIKEMNSIADILNIYSKLETKTKNRIRKETVQPCLQSSKENGEIVPSGTELLNIKFKHDE